MKLASVCMSTGNDLYFISQIVYELPTSSQWNFDVQWCPRNPSVVSTCAFDGHITVHSLMGGTPPPAAPSNKVNKSKSINCVKMYVYEHWKNLVHGFLLLQIADSFGADPFSQPPVPQPQQAQEKKPAEALKKPPKWLRRPVGASFGVSREDDSHTLKASSC